MFPLIKFPNHLEGRKNNQILMVDTDILSDICKNGESQKVEKELLERRMTLLYSLPSIMELGFGPTDLADSNEILLYKELYLKKSAIAEDMFVSDFSVKNKLGKLSNIKGKWVAISPDSHNWYAAKKTLVSYMNDRNALPKNAKGLQVDALISCATWNAGAFLWTNNVKDHLLATYYMSHLECTRNHERNSKKSLDCLAGHMVPIFDTELLIRAIKGETYNIYSEMKKKTDNQDIIKVLEIAEGYINI
jgi:hypothetical protein